MPPSAADNFIDYLCRQAALAPPHFAGAAWFILRTGEDCAYIRLQDLWRPRRFLRQMAGVPPLHFGDIGFQPELVDDNSPVRHYMAFVFVGFWLPARLAQLVLYAWEVAGFFRYGFTWSQRDVHCGLVGLRHGALVRQYGPTVLPAAVAAEFAEGRGARGGVWRAPKRNGAPATQRRFSPNPKVS